MLHRLLPVLLIALLMGTLACNRTTTTSAMDQQQLKNEAARVHAFLAPMYADDYFPKHVVDQARDILVQLCHTLEAQPPTSLDQLYAHTHRATERFNDLQEAFEEAGSELDTGAREIIAMDFHFIAQAYGFDADVEELIAPRDW